MVLSASSFYGLRTDHCLACLISKMEVALLDLHLHGVKCGMDKTQARGGVLSSLTESERVKCDVTCIQRERN